ncbi:hypothetical protein EGJ27_13465 [Pseudomonas sp. v388]|uniref:hypothetical protein n=1 Tax=Pseudomonas sp. v388 TaxID=2479849 RepID=UPI000F788227|nr:hypothetical protein [Pseudomonas sp. v388]RRV06761.1 hypothetical protein EGJ27_13465 [Pseudomonas sp. v388]
MSIQTLTHSDISSTHRKIELQRANNITFTPYTENISLATDVPISKEGAFYTYQKEAWLTEPGYEDVKNREEYVARKKSMDQIDLALIQLTYTQFKDALQTTHPDIAKKSFGFTLGPDTNLKVISYSDSLTEAECSSINEMLNNFQTLKIAIQHQAKDIMILADHDHATFGSARNINLDNFHEIIDYHKVLSCGTNSMQNEWIRQVGSYAEPKSELYISERA